MQIRILGSGAGGGFPQWNCNCRNCSGFRMGTLNARARTQSSIAVSDDGERWVLFNASPDIRSQLMDFPALQPARALRDTGISAIVLMDSQVDHTTGLLSLREGLPLDVWCTPQVHGDLSTGFPLFDMLRHWNGGLNWCAIEPDEAHAFRIPSAPSLEFTAIPLLSNAPPYSPRRDQPHPGDNIGIFIRDAASNQTLLYAPGLGQPDERIKAWMAKADVLLVDGTVWHDDEMIRQEVGTKTGQQMGHLAQAGQGGMIELLDTLPAARKILIHINNTNPILDEDSPERAELAEHGIEVSWDGMHIHL
ncbi:pyrroloquinoline quinone biosynthesis protein PqqB [Marinobacter daepoensis]|uniref:Coenzyme PQQ synthesis protein B n=1 Tax=Marinobacter daepoensis TaxID=262077 RepID=A0ABS3BF30_9GAMM|nr:pyrroloquinoline quinone biosynthesis protein PqqB [Marinobacter daepoensis]MBN7770448.1 pyrroloquinoline quinone biosynthesis protein PqqB [Marinobacter daepoensis]MBY6033980.1 pyrroloquinoline quinone biosynthesis protein PqqB [Marinobacter daepoensis]MBY6079894.1 pyrroloquinoline quinone biosynthesis protein PqqB [Marinobacter daepoensis]